MVQQNILDLHISGEAQIKVGTGINGALEVLGVSVDGVSISITEHTLPYYTDSFGGLEGTPAEEIYLSQDAMIRCQLVFYDDEVLGLLRGRMNVGNTDGEIGRPGTLYWLASGYYRLLVFCPLDRVWNFPMARLKDAAEFKVGTRRTAWNVTFYAVPLPPGLAYAGGEVEGTVLYNNLAN